MISGSLAIHINKTLTLSEAETASIISCFEVKTFRKKEMLLTEGEKCRNLYFVDKGCLRMFFYDEKGTEQTIQFALENWWMTDLNSFNTRRAAEFNIQAIEQTEVYFIEKTALDQMLESYPAMEKYFNIIYQRAYAASLMRIKYVFSMSKEQVYENFSSRYPEFIQRVPQYILASFLGFTPEYLSELRKKKFSK